MGLLGRVGGFRLSLSGDDFEHFGAIFLKTRLHFFIRCRQEFCLLVVPVGRGPPGGSDRRAGERRAVCCDSPCNLPASLFLFYCEFAEQKSTHTSNI